MSNLTNSLPWLFQRNWAKVPIALVELAPVNERPVAAVDANCTLHVS